MAWTGWFKRQCGAVSTKIAIWPAWMRRSATPEKKMQETDVILSDGIWKIQIRDDGALQIIDEHGRQRHVSKNHSMTGVHLAMQLARIPLPVVSNLDEALKMAAEKFVKGN